MKLGVIGIGKLGLSFALLCEKKYSILGSDINNDYVDSINQKKLKTYEPNIEELLSNSKNLLATTDNIEVIKNSDIIFTFVQTPSLYNGSYDHENIENIILDFKKSYENGVELKGKIFVIGSTTMPGYVKTVEERLSNFGVSVCYNPEFIAQGEIVKGLEYADMVLIGSNDDNATKKIVEIYKNIMKIEPTFNVMSNTAAEITKISINCFLTTKISFANMIGQVCVKSGVNDETKTVLKAIGDDKRIGNKYLNFGYGYGGPCLPRDNRALGLHMERINLKTTLPYVIDEFNQNHNDFLVNEILIKYPEKNTKLIVHGVSYKKGTNILTESQQLKLVEKLLSLGYNVGIIESEHVINLISDNLKNQYGDLISFSTQYNNDGLILNI